MSSLNQEYWYHFISCIQDKNFANQYFNHPFLVRLCNALQDKKSTGLDIAYALRDVLACVQVTQHYANPLVGELIMFDTRLSKEVCEHVGLVQSAFKGSWSLNHPILAEQHAVYLKQPRRFIQSLDLDPVLKSVLYASGITHYNGEGQRQTIRTILSSPHDAVIFIQLPTGCGKTLAIHALSLMEKSRGLILVIIPTIGLGIEQALRAQQILAKNDLDHGGSYVWHGKTSPEERQNIRRRINEGTQRILFCAPEAAVSSLRAQLFDVAKQGLINAIFVDEAHLIDTWGGDFRPEFQLLPALVRSLKYYAAKFSYGIRLILMSATFSQTTWDLMKKLFKDTSPFLSVNGSFLRPEIQFNLHKARDSLDHQQQVLACLHQLPRPIILYNVTLADAEAWYQTLQTLGLNRIGLFHGDTSIKERQHLIHAWQANQIDIMVATSAFGVGMDKSDVHSVLHAAVPENMDRFYQEAGRGGRDGAACLSWLIYHDEQLDLAEKMSQNKLIGVDIGFERWVSMCQNYQIINQKQMSISLSNFRHSIGKKSDKNLTWNIRTLLLMQRAGLIQLHYMPLEQLPLPHHPVDEDELAQLAEQRQQNYEDYQDRIFIQVLHDNHMVKDVWEKLVTVERQVEKNQRQAQFLQLRSWLQDAEQPLCQQIQQFYTLNGYAPEYSCGGCPGCQVAQRDIYTPTLGKSVDQSHIEEFVFADVNYVYYPETHISHADFRKYYVRAWSVWITRLLQNKTITAIRASRETLAVLSRLESVPFWIGIEMDEAEIGVAELVLVLPTEAYPTAAPGMSAPFKLIIAPEHLPDPMYPHHRLWWETKPNIQSLNDFINREKVDVYY